VSESKLDIKGAVRFSEASVTLYYSTESNTPKALNQLYTARGVTTLKIVIELFISINHHSHTSANNNLQATFLSKQFLLTVTHC
jgi:hypothetical protein